MYLNKPLRFIEVKTQASYKPDTILTLTILTILFLTLVPSNRQNFICIHFTLL